MSEKERNKRLYLLLQKLILESDNKNINLLKTMVAKDTPAMQKSFEIITGNYDYGKS